MPHILKLGIGVVAGQMLIPMVLQLTGIQAAPGFGIDDIVIAATIVASIMLVGKIL